MEVDDIVKLILSIAFSISMLGISIQVMRILGTLNATMQDIRYLAYKIADLLENINEDYKNARNKLKDISDNFIKPVSDLAATVGSAAEVIRRKI